MSISKVLQLVLPSHMLKKFRHNLILMLKFGSLSMIIFWIIIDAFAPVREYFFAMFVDKEIFFPLHVFGRVKICPFAPNLFNLGVNQQAGERERDQGTLACSCSIKTLACSKKMPAAHNWETKEGRSPKQSKWHCDKELLGRRQHWRQHIHYQSQTVSFHVPCP